MSKLVHFPHQFQNVVYRNCFWLGAFSSDECDRICQYYDIKNLSQGTTGTENEIDSKYRQSNVYLDNHNENSAWIYQRLFDIIDDANHKFFQYELIGFDFFQYTTYNMSQYYNYHIDTVFNNYEINRDSNLCRKLSLSILLNDPGEFDGGEFEICIGDPNEPESHKLNKGDAIFFPSYMLHRVKGIARGIRKSLVVWVLGPKWK